MNFLFAVMMLAAATGFADAAGRAVPQNPAQIQLSFAPVVSKVAPAVVNVYARRVIRQPVDPLFQQFFGASPMRNRVEQSLGSGVIVRPDGIIVTNNHVIEGGQDIQVALQDRREYQAKVVLADPRTDLAVLRIDTKGEKLPALEFGDSDKLQVGDLVLAIGDPFGVGQTVTSGIVSALGALQWRRVGLPVLHPDRCGDQSGQFRRRAGQHGWQADRHQFLHRVFIRRQYRYRFCDPVQHGARRAGWRARRRHQAAMVRRRWAGRHRGYQPRPGSAAPGRRADLAGLSRKSGCARRGSRKATWCSRSMDSRSRIPMGCAIAW